MKPDINHILRIYLGTDESGGYEPLYREEPMRRAFPERHPQMMKLTAPYLDEDQTPDRSRDLNQEAERLRTLFEASFPNLTTPLFGLCLTAGISDGVGDYTE